MGRQWHTLFLWLYPGFTKGSQKGTFSRVSEVEDAAKRTSLPSVLLLLSNVLHSPQPLIRFAGSREEVRC